MSEDIHLAGRHYKHRRDGFAVLSVDMRGHVDQLIYVTDSRADADDEARRFAELSRYNLIVLPICATYFRADAADLPLG